MKKTRLAFVSLLGTFGCALSAYSVGPSLRMDAEASRENVYIGDRVSVESKVLTSQTGISKVVKGIIHTPSGGTYVGKAFTATEPGLYRVVWRAAIDNEDVSETKEYLCLAKGTDLFDVSGTTSKSFGNFSFNESYTGAAFTVQSGSSIEFNREFDITAFNKNRPFIDFCIDPATYAVCDFTQLNVRLTDASDVNNYVEFVLYHGGSANLDRIYTQAKFAGGFFVGYGDEVRDGQWVHYIQTGNKFGAGIQSSFCASKGGGKVETNSIKLYYDNDERACYVSPAANGLTGSIAVIDFDDPDVFKGVTWDGFKSNNVIVSMTPSTFSSGTGKIVVGSVGGYDLSSEIIKDDEKPVINVNVSDYCDDLTDIPNARVGSTYRVFSSTVSDNFDANLKANVQVKYMDKVNGQIDVPVSDGRFETKYEGTYNIIYTATDSAGNEADRVVVPVSSTKNVQDISMSGIDSASVGELYTKYTLPVSGDLTVTGGSGKINITRTVTDPDGNIVSPDNNGQIFLDDIGDYTVKFDASDICGNTGTFVTKINVPTISRPKFIEEPNLPAAFMKNYRHEISPIKGVEVVDGRVVELESDVMINGNAATGITPSDTSDVSVSYVLNGKSGSSDVITRSVPTVDTENGKNQEAYFQGDLSVVENTDNMLLTATESNQKSQFINKISTADFSLRFTKIATKSNFDSFYVKLVDADDSSNTLTITIDLKNSKYYLPGIDGTSGGDFTVTNSEFGVGFTNSKKILTDVNQSELSSIGYNDNHETFEGFPNGAYLTIGFNTRKGNSAVRLNKINNQTFGYDTYGMGITKENASEDSTKPTISFNDALIAEQFIGDEFRYPTFTAYDVLSDVVETSVTVTNSNGVKVKGDCNSTDSFTIAEYGTYTIKYTAKDACGNETKVSKTVFVYDSNAPTLSVNKLSKTEYKTGDTITIPGYTANDDSGKYTVDVILSMPDNEYRLLTHDVSGEKTIVFNNTKLYENGFYVSDDSFKVSAAGSYKLRYVCYDDAYNKTVIELPFTVK